MKQPQDKSTVDIEDIFVWPCGTWCFRYESEQITNRLSDDHSVLYFDSDEWTAFHLKQTGV